MNDILIVICFVLIAFVGSVLYKLVTGSSKRPEKPKARPVRAKPAKATSNAELGDATLAQHAMAHRYLKNKIENYDGAFTLRPFGHDLINPTRRDIPRAYHGTWVKTYNLENSRQSDYGPDDEFVITAWEIRAYGLTMPVVLVEDRGTNQLPQSQVPEIAVVCEERDKYGWRFWMMMLSLQDSGKKLVDIEAMDAPWTRVNTPQRTPPPP